MERNETSRERIDEVNDKLRLIQNESGLTFGTDALLLAGYIRGGYKKGLELGGGSGIISMLLLTREKVNKIDCAEIQESYATIIGRNAELNGLTDRLTPILADIRELKKNEEYDIVFTNPPYMTREGGKRNLTDEKNIARHEENGNIYDFLKVAARSLKYGSSFYAVYRPDRTADLFSAMREAKIEPKRMTLVYANTKTEPSMLLIEGKKGGKPGMKMTAPLIIYTDENNRQYGPEMDYIMENGAFPPKFLP